MKDKLTNSRKIKDRQDETTKHAYAEFDRAWFAATLKNTGEAVIVTDTKGVITYLNPVAEVLTGWKYEDALGQVLTNVFHIINEETRALAKNPVRKALQDGRVVSLSNHTILIAKDGAEFPIDGSAALVRNEAGTLLGVVLIFRDITERKRAMAALREAQAYAESIVETLREPLVVLDAELRVLSANRAFYETFHVTREETEHLPIYELGNHQWDIPELRELLEEILPQNTTIEAFVVDHDFPRIGQKTMLLNARRIYREANRTQMILMAIEDITERKQAEAKLKRYSERLEKTVEQRTLGLRQAQEELVRKERLAVLGQLAGGVGHELRNPLGAIKNAAYFLNMVLKEPDPEVKETLEILDKEVATSERIISSLLDFARAKAPTYRIVDINDIVQKTLGRINVPENVEVVSHLDRTLPSILADPEQLNQVFENIARNAIQAMPKGGQLVVMSEGRSPEWVVVSFADTGAGIPEKNLGKIFEPLFTTKSKGIGLGLAVAKTLVEGHGGTIEVQSEVDKGSTFKVYLPMNREERR
ncbi:MAG: PAS domain S-box protein [Candidatus Heimdallarchaeota archaeon]